jgi:hypothetical protein
MTTPTLLLGFALATMYGAGFHLWQGGSARRLALYLLSGWLGFVLGHFLGDALGLRLLAIGTLNWLTATLGSVVALFAARWLTTRDAEPARRR